MTATVLPAAVRRPAGTSDAAGTTARVVLGYGPARIEDVSRFWVEDELSRDRFAAYLRQAYDLVPEGEGLEEFVSKGCGASVGATLRVERPEGGSAVGAETAVEVRRRK